MVSFCLQRFRPKPRTFSWFSLKENHSSRSLSGYRNCETALKRDFEACFKSMQCRMLLRDLPPPLNAVPPAGEENSPRKPSSQVPQDRRPHRRIEAGVGIPADDWGRMLGAPPGSGVVDDRD